jgi:G patch domain-containing protein 1
MASDSEGDDYVYYGTPLEQEQTSSYYARPSSTKDTGQVIGLPVHKQQVRDEHGRQRFHGAFTGGFSAGYYNTVGSAVCHHIT